MILSKYSIKKKETLFVSWKWCQDSMTNVVKTLIQYQAHKTHTDVGSFITVGVYFTLSLTSSSSGTGTLPTDKGGLSPPPETGVVGILAPIDQWNKAEVMPLTFWGKVIQRTQLLPGSLTLSLSFSLILTLFAQGTSHHLARKPGPHGETTWRCPSWRWQLSFQPTASIKPRFMGGLASSGPSSQPSHLPSEAPCMEHRTAVLTESPSIPHLQKLTGQ